MRINALITEQPLKLEGLQDILSKLNVGDVVKAKVLEMTSGEILLKLFDGSVMKASTATEIDTAPGEQIELLVKGKIDGKLMMETVKNEAQKPDTSQKELKSTLLNLDIKPDSRNLQLAGEIKSSGRQLTKQLFDTASEMLEKFSSLTPEKAVFLSTRNIKPETQNINTLVRLVEGNLKLGGQLDDLLNSISRLNLGSSEVEGTPNGNSTINGNISPNGNDKKVSSNKAVLYNNNIVENEAGNKSKGVNTSQVKNNNVSAQTDNIKEPDLQNDSVIAKTAVDSGTDDNILDLSDKYRLNLGKFVDNEKNIHPIQKEAKALNELKDAFKSLFIKTDSEDLKNDLNVKQLYKDIVDKLDSMKAFARSLPLADKTDFTARISNIEDGINLLNQISNSSTYVQIPLNISGFNTTGELYIMKKEKNRKRIDPHNVTMLIALDTQNIGHIETLIDVKDKNVGINLRAEDQKVMDFIKENFRHLYGSLQDKGYRLVDVKYRLIEEKTNLINAERTTSREFGDGRVSVDFRI